MTLAGLSRRKKMVKPSGRRTTTTNNNYATGGNDDVQQVAVFSRTWPAARRAGQYMPHKAGIDAYFISVGERQPAQQVCIAKNSFPVSRASLRTFLRKLI
jgi:hypothetical protein